jgi:phosphopantetheinyl transferase (holo-ACP synthase)
MLGNDVVDLRDPEAQPGATHPRFDERVFDGLERAWLGNRGSPTSLRWTLWAAKESSFKAARKIDPRISFSPARFAVRALHRGRARVVHAGRSFAVRIAREDGMVHAVAFASRAPGGRRVSAAHRLETGDLSDAVRRLAIERLAPLLGVEAGRLSIASRGRIPSLLVDGRPTAVDLSLSHHGAVAAFAALVPHLADAGPLRPTEAAP